jgi:toxin YoeB
LKIGFNPRGWDDYRALRDGEPNAFRKLESLIEECRRTPFRGAGKPEPLRENFKGFWSRRITQEHRLVYRVVGSGEDQVLEIAQCRFHY